MVHARGGYEGFGSTELPSWVELFPSLYLPDDNTPVALYFGQAGMNPAVDQSAAKELAPIDASLRSKAVALGASALEWDSGDGSSPGHYYPGVTFALPWLHELRRSGLLFSDFTALTHPATDWTTPSFPGEEGPTHIDYGDVALILHYLQTRILAHRDIEAGRWTYLHLHDLSSLENPRFDQWVVRADPTTDADAFEDLITGINALSPVLRWAPRPEQP